MPKTIRMKLTADSIDHTIERLTRYGAVLQKKGIEICKRLAKIGVTVTSMQYDALNYKGEKHYDITVKPVENGFAIVASGSTVLILEFGAGITFGYGHPLAGDFGMGPGTYPGQKHAMDPRGWWLPKSAGGGHTYGNMPSKAMYNTGKWLRDEVEAVAREVFRT